MKNPNLAEPKLAVFLGAAYLAVLASPALADWRFEGGEGSNYAFETDGGFVEGSFQNGMMFFCTEDGRPCELRVTINGEMPERGVVVTLVFSDGQTIQRIAEELYGDSTQIGWEGAVLEGMMSQADVSVSIGDGPVHTFSLTGSSAAIRRAMGG